MIRVVNRKFHRQHTPAPDSEYIGRPSPLGNPFVIGRDGTRDEVIAQYEQWITTRILNNDLLILYTLDLLEHRARTQDLDLVCWCAPLPCHGDIIKALIERRISQ